MNTNQEKETKNKTFRLIVIKEETGEKLIDEPTNCIIGGIEAKDGKSSMIAISACNAIDLCGAISAAQKAVEMVTKGNESVKLLLDLKNVLDRKKEEESK